MRRSPAISRGQMFGRRHCSDAAVRRARLPSRTPPATRRRGFERPTRRVRRRRRRRGMRRWPVGRSLCRTAWQRPAAAPRGRQPEFTIPASRLAPDAGRGRRDREAGEAEDYAERERSGEAVHAHEPRREQPGGRSHRLIAPDRFIDGSTRRVDDACAPAPQPLRPRAGSALIFGNCCAAEDDHHHSEVEIRKRRGQRRPVPLQISAARASRRSSYRRPPSDGTAARRRASRWPLPVERRKVSPAPIYQFAVGAVAALRRSSRSCRVT